MTTESEDMDYNRRLWKFVKIYCDRYSIKSFSDITEIKINTLSRNLKVDGDDDDFGGTFAGPTFNNVAKWAREFEAERLAQGLPVELDGFELPQRPGFQQGEETDNSAPEEAQNEAVSTGSSGDAGEIPSPDDPRTEANEEASGDKSGTDDGLTDGTEAVIPEGVSITRPELRDNPGELWNRPAFFGEDPLSADLERTFVITRLTAADLKGAYAGWLGPSLPEGVTFTTKMHDEIVRLTRNWQRHANAYEISAEVENLKRHYAFRYIWRGKLELEVVMLGEFWMTPPDAGIPWQELQRRREIEWRVEQIAELKDVEYPSFQEILLFGTIRIGKAVFAGVSKAAAWSFRRIFRRPRQ